MRLLVIPAVILLFALNTACNAYKVTAEFLPASLPPVKAGVKQTVVVIVRADSDSETGTVKYTVALRTPSGVAVTPKSLEINVEPNKKAFAVFNLKYNEDLTSDQEFIAEINSKPVAVLKTTRYYDLSDITWKSKLDKDGKAQTEGWINPDFNDSSWISRNLPALWSDVGITYLRAKIFVPESWSGQDLKLQLAAVDDTDICYFNGVKIGSTEGWDLPRSYKIGPDIIKYGRDNLVCIAVDNTGAGGGIYRTPNYIGTGKYASVPVRKPKLSKPKPIGKPLPFRRMVVKNGVLLYEDGGEVALWGANYYPQSWYQFDNMKRLGVDMKKAVRDDLDDMKRMGVEVIRIHVFDREISDRKGNLVDNEHLDLLDYLVSEASKRGIYFFFTPIAWWWGPNQNPDSFSALTPKDFMFCDDEAIQAQANYLKNWLNRKNRYTGKCYKDEPAICVFEIMNEPTYADYAIMTGLKACYDAYDPAILTPFKERLKEKWRRWLTVNKLDDDARYFPLFRYELFSSYLDTMYQSIRHTGAKQPIASALFETNGQDDLISAIADSRCEAVTTSLYAGAWDKPGDDTNYLTYAENTSLDPKLDKKVRFIYEFDGIETFGSYFYPACARKFRNMGVQVCCMFQYDSSTTSEWNTDWDAHYLNWLYTPGKAVSFYIGGLAFHDLKRGQSFPTEGTTQTFGNCAVSFDKNLSVYAGKSIYSNSEPYKTWKPLSSPAKPEFIMSVGDSPYASYSGTGIYTLGIDYKKRSAMLTINPDAMVVGDPWKPDYNKSAVVLKDTSHPFTLKLPGIKLNKVARVDDAEFRTDIDVKDNTFQAGRGAYQLMW